MTLNLVKHEEREVHSEHIERDEFMLGQHYKVVRFIHTYPDGSSWKPIRIEVEYEDKHYNYIPEIYYDDDFFGDKKPFFRIETTSYGSMGVDDIKKVVAGYEEALEAVEVLTKHFC